MPPTSPERCQNILQTPSFCSLVRPTSPTTTIIPADSRRRVKRKWRPGRLTPVNVSKFHRRTTDQLLARAYFYIDSFAHFFRAVWKQQINSFSDACGRCDIVGVASYALAGRVALRLYRVRRIYVGRVDERVSISRFVYCLFNYLRFMLPNVGRSKMNRSNKRRINRSHRSGFTLDTALPLFRFTKRTIIINDKR